MRANTKKIAAIKSKAQQAKKKEAPLWKKKGATKPGNPEIWNLFFRY
jgi:hypothetical protein